jgi:beta-galactosidase
MRLRPAQVAARVLAALLVTTTASALAPPGRAAAAPGKLPAASPPAAPAAAATADFPPADPAGGPKTAEDVFRYLEDPAMTGEGQQAPHSVLRPYGDARTALRDAAEHAARSPWTASLNGDWRLRIVDRPADVPAGFHAAGYDVSRWPSARVPHTWQSDFIDHPMFRNIPEEIYPDDPPRVPHDVNPTGAYVRGFDVPRSWDGRRTFLRFEAVTSGYFVWVNGRYLGYDQGGYTPAEFDVTEALRPGRNTVAVQVHRWGSGSYLEDVDQWRYSGIFRDVWLYSTPQARLSDLYVTTDLDAAARDATLSARVDLARAAAGAPGRYTVRGTLVDPAGRRAATVSAAADLTGTAARATLIAPVRDPAKWSAEEPNRYTLLLELLDPAGRVTQTTSQTVGFREVAVADRQVLVNGKRILIKGVNRAETDPDTGRYNTRAAQRRDVMLMKSLHVNAVRTSHYPSDPYLYHLADRYGLWVDDEVDIETHSHENCPSNCLASRPEWQTAFADRFQAMVARDKNHPSVIFWDTGNEAGLGTAHHAMAAWADANEPTRLLYHQSNNPDGDAPFADVWGPRYPTPASLEQKALTTTKPIVMGEYAHAMGNGLGNFDEFWDLARRYPQVQGGFIWDWAEQNLRQPLVLTPDSSPNRIQSFLVGKPGQEPGRRGRAVSLSGLDDFVDVFRDPRLDVTGSALTLDAWVRPGAWRGSFPIVTKGQQYGLQMRDQQTLEFGVDTGDRHTVAAAVPADWYGSWHRVTGVYDGAALRLYIDGAQVGSAAATGELEPGLYEVNVGRNAQTQQDNYRGGHFAVGLFDDVRIYPAALSAAEVAGPAKPAAAAVLALDFDRFTRRGDFLSLGPSLSGTDGLVGSDRYLQPETVQLAWSQSPVRFTAVDAARGRFTVRNEQQAGTFEASLRWSLVEVDRTLRWGTRSLRLAPGQSVELDLGAVPANPKDVERWFNLSAHTTRALPWAPKGWRLGYDQFAAGGRLAPGVQLAPPPAGAAARLTRDGTRIVVSGPGWRYRFDTVQGTLTSMDARGRELLRTGPRLDVYRPPTSNETYDWGTADRELWHDLGLDRLRTQVSGVTTSTGDDGSAVVEVRSTAAGPGTAELASFDQVMRYTIDARGTIALDHRIQPRGTRIGSLPYLPRIGFSVQVPRSMQRFAWYGRGPQESYNDRKDGTPVGVWKSTVDDEYVRYSRPQAYGNHTDTRWATLNDGRGSGLLVAGELGRPLDVSVTPYDALDRAEYDFQLPLVRNRDWVTLHVEHGETGMGETPNSVLPPYRVRADRPYDYSVTLRPLTPGEVAAGGVPDSRAPTACPPDLTVASDGQVEPGTPERVEVEVAPRCAGGLDAVSVALAAPAGWTVTPATVDLGRVETGSPERAAFIVTAPAGADVGSYPLDATVAFTSPPGLRGTARGSATVRVPLPPGSHWVSDLPFSSESNGWGPVERDRSNAEQAPDDGRPLSIGGTGYEKGLGVHALSDVQVALDGRCTLFTADTGVDDETGNAGSVAFEVWVDGTRRYAGGVLRGSGGAEPVSVDVTGGQVLRLVVTDGGDGNGNDHADWAAARLRC